MEDKPLKDCLQGEGVKAEALNLHLPPGRVFERHNQAALQGLAKP